MQVGDEWGGLCVHSVAERVAVLAPGAQGHSHRSDPRMLFRLPSAPSVKGTSEALPPDVLRSLLCALCLQERLIVVLGAREARG